MFFAGDVLRFLPGLSRPRPAQTLDEAIAATWARCWRGEISEAEAAALDEALRRKRQRQVVELRPARPRR